MALARVSLLESLRLPPEELARSQHTQAPWLPAASLASEKQVSGGQSRPLLPTSVLASPGQPPPDRLLWDHLVQVTIAILPDACDNLADLPTSILI